MKNAFSIVKDFEQAISEYTGAPYVVCVNSCTNALFLALRYHRIVNCKTDQGYFSTYVQHVNIPKFTYISVPMQIKHAGFEVTFRDEEWEGAYQIKPFAIWDAARRFTSEMYLKILNENNNTSPYVCVSFHWNKILGIQQGGAILHNDYLFDQWARKARFDGRTEGTSPSEDNFNTLGWHMYMSPEIAAGGLVRLNHLPRVNEDLPNDNYPDLSKIELFK